MLQTAIGVEFGTLPPYLYALYSIPSGENDKARALIKSVVLEEMIHMCLASNILNSLGGTPELKPQKYPGPLPGDIGSDGTPVTLHLYPFSVEAVEQAMKVEQPESPPDFPVSKLLADAMIAGAAPKTVTIGQFYRSLDGFLQTLPANAWHPGRNQVVDTQFFAGQIFAINDYSDGHKAIQSIVSEGEGSRQGSVYEPLDFQDELAHYFRFGEIFHDRVLTRDGSGQGYSWGPQKLGVNWKGVYQAISDPGEHDFSKDSAEAQSSQKACNDAYSSMVDALQRALIGQDGALGEAVRAMFNLRAASVHAFTEALADGSHVAGPAFIYSHN